VAFSGTVEIEPYKYTEDGMNGPKVKDIAEEFKKPGYKILIVANKFQTGFDQPLLHTMYVDKALGGVATVQTLSRLNRTTKGKQDTFIIDFVNKQEDIKKDFQNYYQSTILDQGTDKQKLYNLKYEIEKADVFTKDEVTHFIEMFVRKKVKSEVLSPFFKKIVDERYLPLSDEDKDKFRKMVNKYVRQYSFISQIITFIDTDLEKFYLFTKLLFKYLPYEKETLPLEVTQMVDMDKYKIQEEENGSIILNPEDATL
jgi:type I restriction enzyme R subunit